jgi:hypothetical protein
VFTPATRNGIGLPSRIKYKYVFSPPLAVLRGRVARVTDDVPIAGATVRVTGARVVPGRIPPAAPGGPARNASSCRPTSLAERVGSEPDFPSVTSIRSR